MHNGCREKAGQGLECARLPVSVTFLRSSPCVGRRIFEVQRLNATDWWIPAFYLR